jgi:two-component system OmpR family response regulator
MHSSAGQWRCADAIEAWRRRNVAKAWLLRRARPAAQYAGVASAAMPRRIAIVEDDPSIRENVADVLRRQGYDAVGYADRPSASAAMKTRLPDLAIVDIGLAGEVDGGFALVRELRAASETLPIIFLTARDSEFDTVSGLRLGADDYLTKDVSLPHLLARIAALFRRVDAQGTEAQAEDVVERGPLRLDTKRVTASWRERRVDLTLTEFWIVHALARHPGHVKNREQLMGEARMVVDDSTVTSHVKRVRKKLLAVDPGFDRIESVYGMGYRWREE